VNFEDGGVQFEQGDVVKIVNEDILGNKERFAIRTPEVFNDVKKGDYILMDDGKLRVDITDSHSRQGIYRCDCQPALFKEPQRLQPARHYFKHAVYF